MKLLSLRPLIRTNQLEETIRFYTEVLGFTCDEKSDDWGWASLHKDDIEWMIATPNAHTPFDKPVFTGSFYINTDNVDELWEAVKDKAGIAYAIETFEWQMREFAIYDNNGYTLQFGQQVETDATPVRQV